MIVEDNEKGIIIPDLTEYEISSADQILAYIMKGNKKRTMASTHSNTFSSRSHAILNITLEQVPDMDDFSCNMKVIQSKLTMIDLAGSERASVTKNRGIRLKEGANINRSLLALGNCINILSDTNKKGAFVPYRDSKLTRLLKHSLGGNTITIMIACISSSYQAYEETINTLKYANRARCIEK